MIVIIGTGAIAGARINSDLLLHRVLDPRKPSWDRVVEVVKEVIVEKPVIKYVERDVKLKNGARVDNRISEIDEQDVRSDFSVDSPFK